MGEETKKKAGAQACNKNARKYGFYMKVMDEEERKNFKLATEVEGLDSEIALMRGENSIIDCPRPGKLANDYKGGDSFGEGDNDEI